MDCAGCGTANDVGTKFCHECGTALARACPSCGAANPADAKFCGECGTAVAETPVAAGAVDVPGTTERRLVSVLFLDLVGFTSLSEHRDAEDMRSLLDAYFETAQTVIARHGGVVEKFIGDAVMAVWGTPITHEDDAERAVRSGLELVDAVGVMGTSLGFDLQARCGVLTGEAATAVGVDHQGMVTGDMVNTASRLQSVAEAGSVLVGEATYRAAAGAVSFSPAGELALKGKATRVPTWQALRVVAERQGQNRMVVEPPFVGRAEELRMLKELLHATGREGKARLASVTGIGGIGKSRLAWELLKYVDGLAETVWWHRGRCPSYGDGVTFWALGEMVRMRCGIAETDPPGVSRAKLAEATARYVPDESERSWLEPGLAFLLGLGERPAGEREELFAAWRAFFERISDAGTVALVFEDLQWADSGLLDFIESLLEWSRSRPIFVVTLARPELADRRPGWGTGGRGLVSVHLEPLADDQVTELVTGLVPAATGPVVERIVRRAEGMPLYAVETVRMLADQGVLRVQDGGYELAGDLGTLDVPATLHALVASRLDALGAGERSLLQDASVLGKSFTAPALAAVTGTDPTTLDGLLRGLIRREFLVREADPRSPERGQYAFVQEIIREIAYGMLAKTDRRARHLAVAHHLESSGDDELASAVAAHYVEALNATPQGPDRDALSARARDWLAQAAQRATKLGAPVQALGLAQQALAITPPGRERVAILNEAAEAAASALRREEQLAHLREAVELLAGEDDVDAEVAAMGLVAQALGDHDKVDEMRAVVERMRLKLTAVTSPLARAEYEHALGYVLYFAGDLTACLAALDRALSAYEQADDSARFRRCLLSRANTLMALGRHREEVTLRRGMLAIAREENDLRTAAVTLVGLAIEADEWQRGLEQSLEAAALARRAGCGGPELTALANGAEFAIDAGRWDEADRLIAELSARTDLPEHMQGALALDEALLAAYRGNPSRAQSALDRVVDVTAETLEVNPTHLAWFERIRAVLRLLEGDLEAAFTAAMAAVDAEAVLGPNTIVAASFAGRAALWAQDLTKARTALERMPQGRSGWNLAARRSLEAGVEALSGRTSDAASGYESVLSGRIAVGDRFTHALVTLDAVAVLPPDLVPAGAVAGAREYLSELGASPMLDRLSLSVPVRLASAVSPA